MSLFKIRIKAGTPAEFVPTPLTANVNDSASWTNEDDKAHLPAPSAAQPNAWLDFPVAPGGQSDQISFDPPGPYTLNYVCALHPGETGQIQVRGDKKAAFAADTTKGAFADDTKKGAFGGGTKKGSFGGGTKKGAFGGGTKEGAFGGKTKGGSSGGDSKKGAYGQKTKSGAFGQQRKKGAYGKTTKTGPYGKPTK